jgi:hypothetical protein
LASGYCGNCKVIERIAEERRGFTRTLIADLADALGTDRFKAEYVSDENVDKLSDWLDHYIARSSQGWVR